MNGASAIAIIGAGTMGHGFAQLFAQHGHPVQLADQSPRVAAAGKEAIRTNLEVVVAEGFSTAAEAAAALERITVADGLAAAVAGADFVLEAVFESLPVKLDCWRRLSDHAPAEAILASNTSSFDINELAGVVQAPDRVIGTHWFNPPQIVPCVEVIPGSKTSLATVEATIELLKSLGKAPAVTKNVPGFVANRIQMVMASEAFRCLEEGVASAEDIDQIVKTSFGFRLGAYGIFEIADLAGLDTYLGVYDYLLEKYEDDRYRAPRLLRELVEQGKAGVKAGGGVYGYSGEEALRVREERDRKLYARLRAYLGERDAPERAVGAESGHGKV